jgi:hypothetical protein
MIDAVSRCAEALDAFIQYQKTSESPRHSTIPAKLPDQPSMITLRVWHYIAISQPNDTDYWHQLIHLPTCRSIQEVDEYFFQDFRSKNTSTLR